MGNSKPLTDTTLAQLLDTVMKRLNQRIAIYDVNLRKCQQETTTEDRSFLRLEYLSSTAVVLTK